jgi:hypothetical protein
VEYFEAYFPEALERLGSSVFGQFYDRSAESHPDAPDTGPY